MRKTRRLMPPLRAACWCAMGRSEWVRCSEQPSFGLHAANPVLVCGCETGVVPALLVCLAGEQSVDGAR